MNQGALEAGDYVYENFERMTGCGQDERDNETGLAKIRDFVRRLLPWLSAIRPPRRKRSGCWMASSLRAG